MFNVPAYFFGLPRASWWLIHEKQNNRYRIVICFCRAYFKLNCSPWSGKKIYAYRVVFSQSLSKPYEEFVCDRMISETNNIPRDPSSLPGTTTPCSSQSLQSKVYIPSASLSCPLTRTNLLTVTRSFDKRNSEIQSYKGNVGEISMRVMRYFITCLAVGDNQFLKIAILDHILFKNYYRSWTKNATWNFVPAGLPEDKQRPSFEFVISCFMLRPQLLSLQSATDWVILYPNLA